MVTKITPEQNCCGTADQPCCDANGIDLDKPIVVCGNPDSTVRLLTKHIQSHGLEGALIAVGHTECLGNAEVICILNPKTCKAVAVITGSECPLPFCNRPENIKTVNYLNAYGNAPAGEDVIEAFPTRHEADTSNLFYSRDCCVKLTLTKCCGTWSANATIEAQ